MKIACLIGGFVMMTYALLDDDRNTFSIFVAGLLLAILGAT